MDRVNGHDTIDIGGGRRGFRNEDLINGVAGTEITAVYLNSIQEEIATVIEAAGIELDPDDFTQLMQAIQWLFDRETNQHAPPFIPVVSITETDPPVTADPGESYVVPEDATGVWAGHEQNIAEFYRGAWRIITTPDGHVVATPDGKLYRKVGGIYAAAVEWIFATLEEHLEGLSESLWTNPKGVAAMIRAALGIVRNVTANIQALANDELWVDTSAGPVIVLLPDDPPAGCRLFVGRRGANIATIGRSGETIEAIAEDLIINRDRRGVWMTFIANTWRLKGAVLAK